MKKIQSFLFCLFVACSATYLHAEQRVYWCVGDGGGEGIYRAKTDGSAVEQIYDAVPSGGSPRGLAIDDTLALLYWTDPSQQKIMVSNLDGTNPQVFNPDIPGPLGNISFDPFNQQIFWSDSTGKLWRQPANLSGPRFSDISNVYNAVIAPQSSYVFFTNQSEETLYRVPYGVGEPLNISPTSTANGLNILHLSSRLLFIDTNAQQIFSVNFDGGDLVSTFSYDGAPYTPIAIAPDVTETNLYFLDSTQGGIFRTPVNGGGSPELVVATLGATTGLALDCGVYTPDIDGDFVNNCDDKCPTDIDKTEPLSCGCGVSEIDSDEDGIPNCLDSCPADVNKSAPGVCGCGVLDIDSDGDGTPNCQDPCTFDAIKVNPGVCGCKMKDIDSDLDGTLDCLDACPSDPLKVSPLGCGCGKVDSIDSKGAFVCADLRTVSKETQLTVPPEVVVNDNDIIIRLEKFSKAIIKKKIKKKLLKAGLLEAKAKDKVSFQYSVNIKNNSPSVRNTIRKVTKRNELSVKNLNPGNYSVNYRVEILKNGAISQRTKFSPSTLFEVAG